MLHDEDYDYYFRTNHQKKVILHFTLPRHPLLTKEKAVKVAVTTIQ